MDNELYLHYERIPGKSGSDTLENGDTVYWSYADVGVDVIDMPLLFMMGNSLHHSDTVELLGDENGDIFD